VIIVGNDRLEVETELFAGGVCCPACSGVLRPWGSARRRVLRCAVGEVWRRPRRGRCANCGGTHVLLAEDSLVRRRDETVVIGAALTMKAAGHGHRSAADMLGLPPSTVRGWFRRFAVAARAASLRLGVLRPWWFASRASKGRLLSNTGCPWAPTV
jgi:hypothetical protein